MCSGQEVSVSPDELGVGTGASFCSDSLDIEVLAAIMSPDVKCIGNLHPEPAFFPPGLVSGRKLGRAEVGWYPASSELGDSCQHLS